MSDIDPIISPNVRCEYYLPAEFKTRFQKKGRRQTYLHMNARSLARNFDNVQLLLDSLDCTFSVVGVSETWLHSNSPPLYDIPNYSLIRSDRLEGRGGGVAFYVNNALSFKLRSDLSLRNDSAELLSIEIDSCLSGKNDVICIIYRPPSKDKKMFLDDLDNLLHDLNQENKNMHLMGDFNIDLLSDNDITDDLNTLLNVHAMFSTITKPTRIDKNTSTLIDNIFTNVSDYDIESGLIYSEVSDHLPIFLFLPSYIKKKN